MTHEGRIVELLDLGRPQDAMALLAPLLATRPDDAGLHRLTAVAQSAMGLYAESLTSARRAVTLDPAAPVGHRLVSTASHHLGRHQDAIAAGQEAVRLDPTGPAGLTCLATALSRSRRPGHSTTAAQVAKRVVQMAPDSADAHFTLGYVLHRSDRTEAQVAYRRCLALQPQHTRALHNLASLQARLAPAVAIEHYASVLAVEPELTVARTNLERQVLRVVYVLAIAPLAVSGLIWHLAPDTSFAWILLDVPFWVAGIVWYCRRMPRGVRSSTFALAMPSLSRHPWVLRAAGVLLVLLVLAVGWMAQQTPRP